MDIRKVKKLIELLEESQVAEIEIHEGEESVRISRMPQAVPAQTFVQAPPAMMAAPAAAAPAAAPAADEPAVPDGHTVDSPMVGTFYEAASPGAKPFVEIHLSNIHAREEFRKESFFSDIAVGVISGLGPVGYELALTAAVRYLDK